MRCARQCWWASGTMACMTSSSRYDDLSRATRTAHGRVARMASVEGGGHNAYLGFTCMSEALPALHRRLVE